MVRLFALPLVAVNHLTNFGYISLSFPPTLHSYNYFTSPFLLLDELLSFPPQLIGVGATQRMREIEAQSGSGSGEDSGDDAQTTPPDQFECRHTKILALTGMSSLEDKRKAFDAGVDG